VPFEASVIQNRQKTVSVNHKVLPCRQAIAFNLPPGRIRWKCRAARTLNAPTMNAHQRARPAFAAATPMGTARLSTEQQTTRRLMLVAALMSRFYLVLGVLYAKETAGRDPFSLHPSLCRNSAHGWP